MAFNGSGTYVRIYNWVTDKANSIKVTASRMDGEADDIATALSTCITKDGQTTITADIPFSGNKITGLAAGTATTDAVNMGQLQDGSATTYTATGASGAYAITPSPAITAYAANQRFVFKANDTNSGEPTLNVSALGVKTIKKGDGQALGNNEIKSGMFCEVVYDGTNFILISPTLAAPNYASNDQVSSTPYTVTDDYSVLEVNTSTAKTLNLPAATTTKGVLITIVDDTGNAATNNVTITPNGTDSIDGVNGSITINSNYGHYRLYNSTNAQWVTV